MTPLAAIRALLVAAVCTPISTLAADILLTPPAGGGVSMTNAAGNTTRFRVADDGSVTVPGVAAVPVPATGLCVEIATGKVGTCSIAGGTVTGVGASAPLASSGGTAPNISLTGTVPVANGGTGATALTANGVVYGQGTGAVATTVGAAGQVLTGTAGAPAWTASPSISGNLTLVNSTAGAGNIMKGANRFIHNFGSTNTFIGMNAGNFTMTGSQNTASGESALAGNTSGISNTASGFHALTSNSTGSNNIAIGSSAGSNLPTGNFNIAIGDSGVAGENSTIRIGSAFFHNRFFAAGIRGATTPWADAVPVLVDTSGQLVTSSASRQSGEASVGSGVAGVNIYTINFPTAFTNAPKVIVTPKTDLFGGGEVSDTIVASVRAISTTQFKVNAYRVDVAGGAWSVNLRLAWMAWE